MTPDEYTNQELFLEVGDGHQLYVHDWGNPDAKVPILFLHGGPGNGCDDRDKKKFDPLTQRIIFHDQRGAGKSLPTASLDNNATDDLVADIGKIAEKFSLKQFVLAGGSWGSTLALCYGIRHPERVKAMVLDGIFTATKGEYDWLDKGGWREFFPDVWRQYVESVPAPHKDDPSAYHFKQALSGDVEAVKRSSYAYLKMELALLKLDDQYQPDPYDKFEPANGQIEIHFLANKCFLPESYILKHANELKMPIYLIQGRYDMVCPPQAAYKLHQALPNSQLIWTINGHLRQHEASNIQKLFLQQAVGDDR